MTRSGGATLLAAVAAFVMLSLDADACNVQMGFPDSCYKDTPRGTEYGTPWGQGKAGTVVPGTESPAERARQRQRDRERAAAEAEWNRQQNALEAQRREVARQQELLEAQRRADFEERQRWLARQEQERADEEKRQVARREQIRQEEQRVQRETERQTTTTSQQDKSGGTTKRGAGIVFALILGAGVAFFQMVNPKMAAVSGFAGALAILAIYVFTGVEVDTKVTLAEVPLLSVAGGTVVGALIYKFA